MSVQWTQFDHLFIKPHDVLVIPINRNFGQLMLESSLFVIYSIFLDRYFKHIALHSKINRGKYWSTFCKHNICQSQGETFFSVDFQCCLKLEMDCVESSLSWLQVLLFLCLAWFQASSLYWQSCLMSRGHQHCCPDCSQYLP